MAHINEFEEKAADYRLKTGAYEELSSSPIEEILSKVTRLLNDLHAKPSQLSSAQYKKMIPSRLTVELAYMYYNPKTHKVMFLTIFCSSVLNSINICFHLLPIRIQ